jgi:putative membrane protein
MMGLIARIVVVGLGLWVASKLVPGVEIRDLETLALAALLLGIANAVVRPIVILITLPLTLITLGLFILVINAAMFGLVSVFLHGFVVHGFFAAFWGALVVSVVGWFASIFIGKRGRLKWRPARRPMRRPARA